MAFPQLEEHLHQMSPSQYSKRGPKASEVGGASNAVLSGALFGKLKGKAPLKDPRSGAVASKQPSTAASGGPSSDARRAAWSNHSTPVPSAATAGNDYITLTKPRLVTC